jgi:dTDP-glucose 4,6-dehydratase
MNRLLITGGAGFIGGNFVHHWRQAHPTDGIVVLDALTYAGNLQTLAPLLETPDFAFVQGDICDEALLADLFGKHDFSHVVHFAAESHVDRSIAAPDTFIQTNINGTHALLKAARKAFEQKRGFERFHHISTDEVYGSLEPQDPAFTEATPYAPRSPYAASKAASDHLVQAYSHTFGLPITISNCSNNYGPYHFPEKLIPLMIVNALDSKPLPIYGDGSNVRDWLHVSDHCAAIATILERGTPGETYNVGGNNEVANIDLVRSLCDLVDARFAAVSTLADRFPQAPAAKGGSTRDLITFVKDRPGHDRRYAINAAKISRELGFEPQVTFTHGLGQTLDWYLRNEPWWRAVQSGAYRDWINSHYDFVAT